MQYALEAKKSSLFVVGGPNKPITQSKSHKTSCNKVGQAYAPIPNQRFTGTAMSLSQKNVTNNFQNLNQNSSAMDQKPVANSKFISNVNMKSTPKNTSSIRAPGFNPSQFLNSQLKNMSQKEIAKNTMSNADKPKQLFFADFKIDGEKFVEEQATFFDNQFKKQAEEILMASKAQFGSQTQSKRLYPSILMKAVENAVLQTQEEIDSSDVTDVVGNTTLQATTAEETPSGTPRSQVKTRTRMRQKVIKLQTKSNKRFEREMKEVPILRPFGDDKYWKFETFPRIQRNWEKMNKKDKIVAQLIAAIHAIGILGAPFFYTHDAFVAGCVSYWFTSLGITMSYHRQLTHRSFKTPKWLEYVFATWGVMAIQGHPMEWVSAHRHHHKHCDDIADPHSPYDGFFWSHMGWLFDSREQKILFDTSNISEMKKQPFYNFLKQNYLPLTLLQPAVFFAIGGMPWLVYGFAIRTIMTWHVTWAVNSVCHVYGRQMWKTGDISMNNPFIGVLAQGEGWHNNHHAFQDSCRHGLKWWQIDVTWYTILALEKLGLATDLKYPTKARMERMAWNPADAELQVSQLN